MAWNQSVAHLGISQRSRQRRATRHGLLGNRRMDSGAGATGMTVLDLFTDDRAAAIEALHNATALYTAHPIVDGLLARLDWPHAGRTLFDPCAGDGSFLDAALRRLIAAGATVDDIVARISGWEIHPGAVASAHERLAATLTEAGFGDATRIARQLVLEHDFLTDAPAATYDAIATNPPYLRFAHVPPMLREQYETTTPDFACSDLLHAFLHRCAQLLTPNGRIAAVTSDRWLFIQTAAQLRERLGSMLSLTHLTRLDASTSFYRPKHRRAGTPPRIHPVEVLLERTGNGITLTSAPIYPDAQPDTDPNAPTLGEVATLKLAPWLGPRASSSFRQRSPQRYRPIRWYRRSIRTTSAPTTPSHRPCSTRSAPQRTRRRRRYSPISNAPCRRCASAGSAVRIRPGCRPKRGRSTFRSIARRCSSPASPNGCAYCAYRLDIFRSITTSPSSLHPAASTRSKRRYDPSPHNAGSPHARIV